MNCSIMIMLHERGMTQHLYPRDTFVSHTLLSSRVCTHSQTCAHECMIYVQDKSIRQARSVLHIAMISARSAKTVATCAISALLQATSAIWRHNKRPIVDRRSPFAICHLPFSRLFVRSLSFRHHVVPSRATLRSLYS